MIRVLHTHNGLDPTEGGVVSAVVGMAQSQSRAGLDVTLLATFRAGEPTLLAEELTDAGVRVELLGPCRGGLHRHPQMKQTVRRLARDSDVLHTHAAWEELMHLTARAGQHLRRPYVISPHGMLSDWSMSQSRWRKKAYLFLRLKRNLNRARLMHYTSDAEATQAEALGLRPSHIVEPLGLNCDHLPAPNRADTFSASYPELSGRPFALFLGRLHPKKGIDLLIDAWQTVPKHACLVIAGPDDDPAYARLIRRQADTDRLRSRVLFTGMLQGEQKAAALSEARLTVVPSRQENFGLVVIESLASETPVLLSQDIDIAREVTEAGAGGTFPLNAEAISQEICSWWDDQPRRVAAASAGKTLVQSRYNWGKIGQRWINHYGDVVALA